MPKVGFILAGLAAAALLAAAAVFGVLPERSASQADQAAKAVAAPSGSGPHNGRVAAEPGEPNALTVVVSGELRGRLEPCGCSSGQLGGLVRRAGWLEQLQGARLLVDNGGLADGVSAHARLKRRFILQSLAVMGYAAVNLAAADLPALRADGLAALGESSSLLVSANLFRTDGRRLLPAGRVAAVPIAAGPSLRVAIVGLMDERKADEGGRLDAVDGTWEVRPAGASLWQLAAEMPELAKADMRVLLFDGPKARAAQLPGIDAFELVVTQADSDEPEFHGPSVSVNGAPHVAWVSSGRKGKWLGTLRVPLDRSGALEAARFTSAPLSDSTPVSTRQQSALDGYLKTVQTGRFLDELPRQRPPVGYIGSQACASCHQAAQAAWGASRHFHALETLVAKGRDRDPDCLSCHVVGLGYQTGFGSAAKNTAGVGCESCHGPGAGHQTDPRRLYRPASDCRTCHDSENSPHFDRETYWPRIRH